MLLRISLHLVETQCLKYYILDSVLLNNPSVWNKDICIDLMTLFGVSGKDNPFLLRVEKCIEGLLVNCNVLETKVVYNFITPRLLGERSKQWSLNQ